MCRCGNSFDACEQHSTCARQALSCAQSAPTIGALASYRNLGAYSNVVLRGVQSAAARKHARLITFQDFSPQRIVRTGLGLERIDGWIALVDTEGAEELAALGKPLVAVAAPPIQPDGAAVVSDNRRGAQMAVQHLVEHQHRRIAFIGWFGAPDLSERFAGYRAGLRDAGLPFDSSLVLEADGNSEEDGERAAEQLLGMGAPCTAIVSGTDLNAVGVMRVLQAAGYHIPADMAIIGFDDLGWAQYASPPLTTVRQPVEELGVKAAQLLLEQLDGRPAPAGSTVMPTQLTLRQSCGCGPAQARLDRPAAQTGWQQSLLQKTAALLAPTISRGAVPAAVSRWIAQLVDSLSAAVQGDGTHAPVAIDPTWPPEAAPMTLNRITDLLALLEEAAARQLAARTGDAAAPIRIASFLQQLRHILLGSNRVAEIAAKDYLENQMLRNYQMSAPFLDQEPTAFLDLGWLSSSKVSWGCLALWSDQAAMASAGLTLTGFYSRERSAETSAPPPCTVAPQRFPPLEHVSPGVDLGGAEMLRVYRIKAHTQQDEHGFLAIAGRLDDYHEHIGIWAQMIGSAFERESLVRSLLKARQSAEEANRLKTRFLASVSHELRTPLNAIIGFAELLETQQLPSREARLHVRDRILANASHLLELINGTLDLAKVEADRIELQYETIDLHPLLQGVLATAAGIIRDRPIELRLQLAADLPPAWADRTRVRQILLNLLSNAAKCTERGAITVRAAQPDPGFLCICVEDTGIGIAPEDQALIFDEFRQLRSSPAYQDVGTGLGLPIGRKLVELHGGRMWVESSPGQGAAFSFTLPVARPATPPDQQQVAVPDDETHSPQVIVVDDTPQTPQSLCRHLERWGYHVSLVPQGYGAREVVREQQPQLVIVNTQLRSQDGWELIRLLREHAETRDIPVLVSPLAEQQTLSLALGASGYLVKPVRAEEINTIIQRWAGTGTTVLIVDDYADAREIARRRLEQLGYRAIEAVNGLEALAIVREQRPDLILLDLMMPKMDGFEVLQRLRENPGTCDIPIIVLTAQVLTESELARLNAGMVTVLQKGVFRIEEVLAQVQATLAGSHKLGGATQQVVHKVMALVHERYAGPLSLAQLASEAGVSQRHLARCFRQELGMTPVQYLKRYRIRQAQTLLATGKMSVAEVATAAGFANEIHFSAVFRKEVGVTPGAYRRGRRPA